MRLDLKPDFEIGPKSSPYLQRWMIFPYNKWFNIYIHRMLHDDDDRALHDHPYHNVSIILRGGYDERLFAWPPASIADRQLPPTYIKKRRPGLSGFVIRRAETAHMLLLPEGVKKSWSVFITGPRIREWGFHCPRGWRHWKEFVDSEDRGLTGKGCE